MNSPTPEHIRARRAEAGLTQTEAAALVHATQRTWQKWESGERTMHPAFWNLFILKLQIKEGRLKFAL